MGLADMLIKCGVKYGSKESIDFCNAIGWVMANEAIKTSAMLAEKYGCYPKFDTRVFNTKFYIEHNDFEHKPLRNSQLLTIAPTGTISTMLGVSGGIEPIFANSYTRMTKSLHGHDEEYKIYTPIVKNYMDQNGLTKEEELPNYFVTSSTISIDERIAMQSIWQSHIDASISSTVNLPEVTTIEDVENLYMNAWKSGLKGITVYRAGCKRDAILNVKSNTEEDKQTNSDSEIVIPRGTIIECSEDLIGKKRKLTTGCGSLHVLGFFDPVDGSLQEVYFNKGSTGGCANFMTGLSRMVSLLCRAGVDIKTIKDQLDSTGSCPSYAARRATKGDTSKGSCCPMAIGNALLSMWEEMQEELFSNDEDIAETSTKPKLIEKSNKAKCPQCGENLRHEGGCIQCPSCGWSKCD